MINDWNQTERRQYFSFKMLKLLTLGALVCVLATGLPAPAQSPPPTNSPPPPNQTEVLRRALREFSGASNDSVIVPPVPRVDSSVTNPPPAAVIHPASKMPPATGKRAKGPKSSELPVDIRPDSDVTPTSDPLTNGLLPAIEALTTNSTNAMAALDDKYTLAIGDRLSFRIVEDEEDPKPLVVADSGELEFLYLGRFPAVGKSCRELARALKAGLEKEYYYQATVIIAVDLKTRSRGKFYVDGAVRLPGSQELPSDEELTVGKAITRAGGLTDFADKQNVKVIRKMGDGVPDKTFKIDLRQILDKGRNDLDLPLKPGDHIIVPSRLFRF